MEKNELESMVARVGIGHDWRNGYGRNGGGSRTFTPGKPNRAEQDRRSGRDHYGIVVSEAIAAATVEGIAMSTRTYRPGGGTRIFRPERVRHELDAIPAAALDRIDADTETRRELSQVGRHRVWCAIKEAVGRCAKTAGLRYSGRKESTCQNRQRHVKAARRG